MEVVVVAAAVVVVIVVGLFLCVFCVIIIIKKNFNWGRGVFFYALFYLQTKCSPLSERLSYVQDDCRSLQ